MVDVGLIIAAGAGSRLADEREIPKPLRKVAGMPLIRRIILSAARAGLKKIVIVVGSQKEKIIHYVRERDWPLAIEFAENPDWQRSNGVSVLAAKAKIQGDFILLMSDHIFETASLQGLRAAPLGDNAALLAVDHKLDTIFDMPDATKVEQKDGKLLNISKELTHFNAVDTGMFLMTPAIFAALDEILCAKGDCSLSEGVRVLAAKGRMGVYDIGKNYWQDVDTADSIRHAETTLARGCRKDTDGFVSRNFNRYISTFISKRLVKTPLTPNQITYFNFAIGLLSAWLAAQGTYATYVWGAVLFKWSSIMDGVDGEMAKMSLSNSRYGQWLDTICDNLTYLVFIIGTIVGVNRLAPGTFSQILSGATLLGLVLVLGIAFYTLFKNTDSGSMLAFQQELQNASSNSPLKRLLARLQFAIKRDFFAVLFLVFALLGKPHWVLIGTALVTHIGWIVILRLRRNIMKRVGQVSS